MRRSPGRKLRAIKPWSAVLRPVVAPQKVGAELVEARAADLAHDEVDLAAENIDHLVYAGQSTCHRTIERRPAEEHELGPKTEGDQDVGAAPHAAVEHHSHP